MFTPAQLRAARGLLDWTRNQLADAAGVSPETIKNIEHGSFRPQESTASAILNALKKQDVEFCENEGVRKRRETIEIYRDHAGYQQFLSDVMNHLRTAAQPKTRQFLISDQIIEKFGGELASVFIKSQQSLKGLEARCLIEDKDNFRSAPYAEYRVIKEDSARIIPFYSYNDRVVIVLEQEGDKLTLLSFAAPELVARFNAQFESYWQTAEKLR